MAGISPVQLTEQNFDLSLEDLKLCPQETVFVEERT